MRQAPTPREQQGKLRAPVVAGRLTMLLLGIAVLQGTAACALAAPSTNACMVEVLVTYQERNPLLPWQKKPPAVRVGYGVVTGDAEVLTTESLVRNQELVELRRAQSGEKIAVQVAIADPQVNLALLKVEDPDKLAGLKKIPLAEGLSVDDSVDILQFDETRQLQLGGARVLQVAMSELSTAPYPSLVYSLQTDVNVNGVGAAVVSGGSLAGLIMSYADRTRVGEMIPCTMIRLFLDRAGAEPYAGFAVAGFQWSELVDPAKRRYLGVPNEEQGILVLSCLPGTGAAESLRSNDVILTWDGQDVDERGFYQDPQFGRIAFSCLIKARRGPGESVPVTVVRDRSMTDLVVRLGRRHDPDALIPENVTGEPASYVVEGGLIIRELTGDYLRAYGKDWRRVVDPRLIHLYFTRKDRPEAPGDRVVILAGVLPDLINVSYHDFQHRVVTQVNRRPIRGMEDVFRIIEEDGHIERLTLHGVGIDLVLDRSELAAANARLARTYRLTSLRWRIPSAGGMQDPGD